MLVTYQLTLIRPHSNIESSILVRYSIFSAELLNMNIQVFWK